MKSFLHKDELKDSTKLFNSAFSPVLYNFMYLSFGTLEPSAWQNYPTKYKFFGL